MLNQMAGDPQVAQINLMHHQHTELPNGKYKKKNPHPNRSKHTRRMLNKGLQTNTRRVLTSDWLTKTRTDVASVETLLILKGSSAQLKIPMQSMPQVWPIHKPLLPENTAKTIQLQAQETHCASFDSWYHPCA